MRPRDFTRTSFIAAALTALAGLAGQAGAAVDPHAAHSMPATDVAAGAMPGDSLYQLPLQFGTARGTTLALRQYRGEPVVVTMFYGTCKAACPLLARAMTETAASLPASSRPKVRFLMVTLDPARDTPAELARFVQEYKLESPQFEVARTDPDGVRVLAASLGIKYRQLPDGTFNHSAVLTALDADGVPRARTETLAAADPAFVSAVAALIR